MVESLYEKVVITQKNGRYDFDDTYRNLYIYNPYKVQGYIVINGEKHIDPSEVDLLENIPGGVSYINWSIPNPTNPIKIFVSNAFMKPHELIFKVEEALPVDIQNTSIDVNIQNSLLDVNITNSVINVTPDTGSVWNVNIQNSSLDVNITNSVINVSPDTDTIWNVSIQNASLDVNITNSVLDVNIQGVASVSIDEATITVDTALADIKVRYPAPQIEYDYSVIMSDSYSRSLDLPFISGIYSGGTFEILNVPADESIPMTGTTNYKAITFSKQLFRPSSGKRYSITLDEETTTSSSEYTLDNSTTSTTVYPLTIDLGSVVTASGVYFIGYDFKFDWEVNDFTNVDIYGKMWIEVSEDNSTWTAIFSNEGSSGGLRYNNASDGKTGSVGSTNNTAYKTDLTFRYIRWKFYFKISDLSGTGTVDYTAYYGVKKLLIWI